MVSRVLIAIAAGLPCLARALPAGRNEIAIRGRNQSVYYDPARGVRRATVLFLPGDGGWRGFAVEMAEALAADGNDVYGWDVKQYLCGFTDGPKVLSTEDIQRDTGELALRLGLGDRRFVLVGWSQGASMGVAVGAASKLHELLKGVVSIGLPEFGVLGWRFSDNLTYVTRASPNEPKFGTAEWIPAIAPLRFGMIRSTTDEYVPAETSNRLFLLAQEPKRLDIIPARSHGYEGARNELFRVLKEQVRWAAGN